MSTGVLDFYLIVGAPGSGKSSQIEHELLALPASRRVLAFDLEHELSRHGQVVRSRPALREALLKAGDQGAFSLIYQPHDAGDARAEFGELCRMAFALENLVLVVDELADVDSPNPNQVVPAWALVLRRGRKRGLRVIAATQRPADINNRLWSFAPKLRAGWLGDEDDEALLAKALRVPREHVAVLGPGEWIERDRFARTVTYGRIAWKGSKPVNEVTRRAPMFAPAAPPPTKKPAPRRRTA